MAPNFSKLFTLCRDVDTLRPFSDIYTYVLRRCALPSARESFLFVRGSTYGLSNDIFSNQFSRDDFAVSLAIMQAVTIDISAVPVYVTDDAGQTWAVGSRFWGARKAKTWYDFKGQAHDNYAVPPFETLRSGVVQALDFDDEYRDFFGYSLSITNEGFDRIKAQIMGELESFNITDKIDPKRRQRAVEAFQTDLQSRQQWSYAEATLWVALRDFKVMADWLAIPWAVFYSNESTHNFQNSVISMEDQWYWSALKTGAMAFYRLPDDQVASTIKIFWVHAPGEWPSNKLQMDDPVAELFRATHRLEVTGYDWAKKFGRESIFDAFPSNSQNIPIMTSTSSPKARKLWQEKHFNEMAQFARVSYEETGAPTSKPQVVTWARSKGYNIHKAKEHYKDLNEEHRVHRGAPRIRK